MTVAEVLESAHHICAMLLEVPNMAMQSIDPQKTKTFSRVLRRALELYDKQVGACVQDQSSRWT
eukprot:4032302-Amphidinium_carterae.3